MAKNMAVTLIKAAWRLFGDAITSISWMTVAIAFSPHFADFFLLRVLGKEQFGMYFKIIMNSMTMMVIPT